MKRIRFIAMLWAVTLMAIGTLPTVSAAGQPETMSLVIKLINGLTTVEQTAVINRNGGIETSSIPALRLHVVTVPAADLSLTLENYQSDPQVESVEFNKTRKAEGIPGDLSYGVQWALSKIGWESAFGTVIPGGSAKLAILDTGVDASHPDLSSNIISGTSILSVTNGLSDPNGHGTSLAGIVAALTDNSEGIAGISYAGVRIMPVTVLDANGIGQDSDIIAGIIWAADNGADVILMGFSNPDFSQNLQDAIDYAWLKGAVMVAAAGNDGVNTITFPAGNRGVVGVSATDQNDALSVGSNYGQQVFLAAPGTDIYTTSLGNSYDYISGTSASSAIVAGVAAFMKAVDPALTNGVIVGRLARSADAIGTMDDPNNPVMFGNGRINMASALVNDITDEVQPTGAEPVGVSGPFVGPYTAAHSIPRTIESISSSPQQSTLTSGIAESTTYNITVKAGEGSSNTATLTVMGLPTDATASFAAKPLKLNNKTVYTLMTVTTAASTPAGNFPLTIANSSNAVTGYATLVIDKGTATLALDILSQTYDNTPKSVTVITSPTDLTGISVTYDGSATAPTNAGSYAVVATLTNDNYQATDATGTLVIGKETATLALGDLTPTYDGTPKAATVTTSPTGLTGVTVTYDGSAVAPSAIGSYAVVATLTNDNYQAANATGTLVIGKGTATLALGDLTPTYDGTPKAATVTTSPAGLTGVTVTYDGSATAPITPGSYAVVATLNNDNYLAADATGTLVIGKGTATLTVGSLTQTYDSTPKAATVTTSPADLTGVAVTYEGSSALPTNPGSYAVVATLNNDNYLAADAAGTLVIGKGTATLTVGSLTQTYDSTPKAATVTTSPADLTGVSITYDGSATAPITPGSYAVVANLTNDNYQAANAAGTLVISTLPVTITWANPAEINNMTPLSITQLNAVASVPGTYKYTPDSGALLGVGTKTLSVIFTPTDTNYSTVSAAVTINVIPVPPCGAPSYLSVPTNNSSGSLSFYWGSSSNCIGATYVLEQSADNNTFAQVYSGTSKSNVIIPVAANGIYSYRVKATKANYADSGFITGSNTCNVALKCSVPSYLTVPTNNSTGSIDISWGASAPIGVSYTLQQSTDGNSFSTIYSGTNKSMTVAITVNGTYYYRVMAAKAGTNYADSDYTTISACSVVLKCSVPSYLTVPANNSTGILDISWGASAPIGVSYTLQQSTDGNSFSTIYSGTSKNMTVVITDNGTYYYRVMATKAGTNYADSDYTTINACNVFLKCGTPSYLTAPATNETGTINVTWGTSDVSGVTYVLQQSSSGIDTTVYSGTSLYANIIVPTDGAYTYKVKAIKTGYADSDFTTTNTCNVALKCGAPASLTVPTTSTTGTINVSWGTSSVSGVTYVLERSNDNGLSYTTVYSGTSLYKSSITMAANGTYIYRVKAIKTGYADSEYSTTNSCSVTLSCGAPALLTVPATNTTGTINVSWAAPLNYISGLTYVLERSNDNGLSYTTVYSGTSLYKNSITMAADGTYIYRVKAIKTGYADSDFTTTNTCNVALKCGAPASLTVPATNTTGTINLSWAAPLNYISGVTYVLQQSSNGIDYTTVYSGTSLYKNSITMAADGTYIYRVKAIKAGYADSEYTTTNSCSVTLSCGAPASLTVPATNTTGIVYVTWAASNVSGVTYTLEQSSDNGQNYTPVYSGTSLYKNNTVPNGTYTYRVKATRTGYISSDYTYSAVSCIVTK